MGPTDEPNLGSDLRSLRRSRGLGLEEASRRSGVSKASLSAWETGGQRPRGPALARLLDALEADGRTKARLLSLADPRFARIALEDSSLGAPIDVGMVLRAMRLRRGVAQADLARSVGATQGMVSSWEAGDVAPSPETIHAVGFALGATVEETLALASAKGEGAGGLPDDPEAAFRQLWGLAVPLALGETVFLGWEAEAWRRAVRDARWEPCLALALAGRAHWLSGEMRHAEIVALAHRALGLASASSVPLAAVPAVAAMADADRHLGRGHARAAELAGAFADRLPASEGKAWMLRQRGMSLARMGRTVEGTRLLAEAADMDLRVKVYKDPWSYRTAPLCEAYLVAGEPRRAAALLEGRREREFHPPTLVMVGHAVGRAATEAEMAWLRHWMARYDPSPMGDRRLAGLESRQAQLTGARRPQAATPDDPKATDRLWAAVLRENRG